MKRKFTKLMAALALLVFLTPSMVGWGQTTVTQTSFSATSGNVNNDSKVNYAAYKGGGTSDPLVNSNAIRLYQNASGTTGGYVVIGVTSGYQITSATIQSTMGTTTGYKLTDTDPGSNTPAKNTFNVSDYSLSANTDYTVDSITTQYIVFACFGTTSSSRLYLSKISITYESTSGPSTDPELSVNPTSIAFGEKAINTTNTETFTVTYANLTEDLTVAGFEGITVNPATIEVGEGSGETTVTVTYAPTAVGELEGNITVSNTDDEVSATVAVTGSAYDPATIVYYTKIEENQTDWSGVYIVTYAGTSSYEALTGVSSSNVGTHASVSVSSGQIISNSTVDAYAVTITKTTGNNYSMQIGGQYLYAQSSNNLYAANDFTSDYCEWTIAWDETSGLVQITNVSQSTRRLQYNSGSPRFACYTGSQKDLTLFKYQGVVVLPLTAPVVTLEAGDQTITPTWEAVANASSYTLQWSTNEGFTEEYTTEITNATSGTAITGLTNGDTYFVRVMAIGDGTNFSNSNWSAVVSAEPMAYVVATPTFSVEGIGTGTDNEFVEVASVTITNPDYNTHFIYYTTDGSDPDDSSEAYDGTPIDIIETTTIKAIAYDADMIESEIGSITINVVATTPIATVYAAEDGDTYYITEGIVTYKRSGNNMFIEDDNAGILVYGTNSSCAVGDRVVIKGTKTTYQYKPELQNITILGKFSSGNTLPLNEISISDASDYIYRRVKFTQVLVGGTSSSLTAISQGDNTIGIYNIPSIANVTEEGYYLKTVTGVVGYYNSAEQLYVASAGDITIYNIDASSNDTGLGTVTTEGYMVIATPATGVGYADPAYVVVSDATTLSVNQNVNNFQVITNGDVVIEIQFAAAAAIPSITADPVNIAFDATSGEITYTLTNPAAEGSISATVQSGAWLSNPVCSTTEHKVTFDATTNNDSDERTGTIRITYTYNTNQTVYVDVTITQAAYVAPFTPALYTKVTSTLDDFSGQYIIVGLNDNDAYAMAEQKANNRNASIISEDGTYATVISDAVHELTITKQGEYYTIYDGREGENNNKGYLYAAGGNGNNPKNYLKTETELDENDNGLWAIEIDTEGNTSIESQGNASRKKMRFNFNNGSPLFSCYGSGQQPVYLYKKSAETPASNTLTVTCTDFGTTANPTKGGYRLIASPFDGVNPKTIEGLTDDSYDLYYFDQSASDGKEWRNYKVESFNFERGKGYLYAKSGTGNVTFNFWGKAYEGNGQMDLVNDVTENPTTQFGGWNLVGNPFGVAAYIDKDYYEMNTDGNDFIAGEDDLIDAMQGVFVVYDATEATTVSFMIPSGSSNVVPAPSAVSKMSLNISRNRGPVIDRAIVRFNEGGLLPKFQLNPNNTKIYITEGNQDYAIVRSENEGETPVCFKAEENGNYTLSVNLENVEMNYLHLIDNMTGTDVDLLATPSYSFEAKTSDYASRFRLVFSANSVEEQNAEAFAFFNGSEWTINNQGEATLQVVDVMGRVLSSKTVNGNANVNLNQTAGIYMLRLVNGNSVKVQKVVVK